ncbi:MAG: MerR family transcriptional regulator [Solirubrobacterales bacterium]|nr:MerR family transcriptional regulator [Solirubrobacterales bacterium]
MEPSRQMERGVSSTGSASTRKALTIGAVAKILAREFDEVSISKIRYLEDQKLLSPRRTPGGYRLYSQADVERLRAILRMQRDEFLPLRVIRQELAAGGERDAGGRSSSSRRAVRVEPGRGTRLTLADLAEQTSLPEELATELEDHGILRPKRIDGIKLYDENDVEIAKACVELSRFGVHGRNLRVFRSSADRESQLIEQLLGPALNSSNPSRRREAIDNLESLATVCSSLKQLLLVRDLRRLTGED